VSGVKNLRAGIDSINRLKAAIKDAPIRVRAAVAQDAAEVLTREIRGAFSSGRTVYDTPRPLSVDGGRLSLVRSGRVRGDLQFVRVGTILRAQIGAAYARFLVGKYAILPQRLPEAWARALTKIVDEYRADFEREATR